MVNKKWLWALTGCFGVFWGSGYLLVLFESFIDTAPKWFLILDGILIATAFILAIVNIVIALKELIVWTVELLNKRRPPFERADWLRTIMGFKLALTIPVMGLVMFGWSLPLMTLNPFMIVFTIWFFLPALLVSFLLYFFAYLLLLATSIYEIHQIIILGRSKTLKITQCLIHIILQFIFFADTIDAIYLYLKYGKDVIKHGEQEVAPGVHN